MKMSLFKVDYVCACTDAKAQTAPHLRSIGPISFPASLTNYKQTNIDHGNDTYYHLNSIWLSHKLRLIGLNYVIGNEFKWNLTLSKKNSFDGRFV
jgi:hypothetical protein